MDLDAGIDQHALVDAVQPRDLAVLVRDQGLPVEGAFADGPAVGAREREVLAEMRGVGEELLRDAADVDAGAAEAAGLGERDLGAVRGGNAAGANAAGAAAYREKIVVENQLTSGSGD
jgi:hypothetical protein